MSRVCNPTHTGFTAAMTQQYIYLLARLEHDYLLSEAPCEMKGCKINSVGVYSDRGKELGREILQRYIPKKNVRW